MSKNVEIISLLYLVPVAICLLRTWYEQVRDTPYTSQVFGDHYWLIWIPAVNAVVAVAVLFFAVCSVLEAVSLLPTKVKQAVKRLRRNS